MWYLTISSSLKNITESQGKVMPSATPRSSTCRASGGEACTVVPPSMTTNAPTVPPAGRIFRPFMSDGSSTFFFEVCSVPGWWTEPWQ